MGAGASAITGTDVSHTDRLSVDAKMRAAVAVRLFTEGKDRTTAINLLRKAFKEADVDNSGALSFDEFRAAASSIGLGVGEKDLWSAFHRFDADGNDSVDLGECVCILFPTDIDAREVVAQQQYSRIAQAGGGGKRLAEATTNVLSAVTNVASVVFEKEINLRRAFKKWDKDGSAGLNSEEMTAALNSLGFSVTLEEAACLHSAFDLDANGTISCWELVRGLGSLTPEIRLDDAALERERDRREAEAMAARIAEDEVRRAREAAAAAATIEASRTAHEAQERARIASASELASNAALEAVRAAKQSKAAAKAEKAAAKERKAARKAAQAEAAQGAQAAAAAAEAEAAVQAAEAARLRRFGQKQFDTEVRDMGAFAWKDSELKASHSDAALIAALNKRLATLRVTPADALAQCTGHPSVTDPTIYDKYGVDPATLAAFTKQLFYGLSSKRAAKLLSNARTAVGLHTDGGVCPEDADVLPVPDFLALFDGNGTVHNGNGGSPVRVTVRPQKAKLSASRVSELSGNETKLLADLRESLFERFSNMKTMFQKVDKDGSGAITVEKFLWAMHHAGAVEIKGGVANTGTDGMGRVAAVISEEEACNIVGFFDTNGDGVLSYAEFMRILQDSLHMLV